MRVKFIHPAIVSGKNPDGSPRAELCRVESDFEIPEYTWEEAPVALTASHPSLPSDYFHRVGGKLFKALPDGLESGHFEAANLLSYSLHNGNKRHIQFEPFHETVSRAAAHMEDDSGYALRVNVTRDLLKREAKAKMREVTKACLTAPMLRKWGWLSPDADAEIEAWRAIAAEKIANVVMIKGVPAVRAFEPCYVLTTRFGAPQIQVASKHVYARQVHVTDREDDGLEALGDDAAHLRTHYFAASDYDGAVAFARSINWSLGPSERPRIRILDEDAVSDDLDVLETVRHARILLSTTDNIAFHERTRANAGAITDTDPKIEGLLAGARSLKNEIISWQDRKHDVDDVRRELTSLAELARECNYITIAVGRSWLDALSPDLKGQLGQFLVRSDQSAISLDIPMSRSYGL
ncbi:hypothetical protein OIU34_19770 [Pararhizobium sp. BT-229]|uniref:hypothetical protein n=1 Tax=Pararhizobium sp. BT-229 TaxID=2986923 RepID=UPI0021F7754E|nr:hypothetical protein [Pararhizobium sp. BT-229]MCV9964124.1 hypothetical protein [Pararhizobium sp. BT-229]